jgi:type I restriction enzyme S subunit
VNSNVSNLFLRYALIFNKNKYANLGIGTTFLEVNKSDTDRFEIFISDNIEEQQRIAQILSSIDEQIELTEKLVEKKRLTKQGLLVNFFSVEPEELLRNIANVVMGQSPSSTAVSDSLDDGLPFLQGCAEFSRRYPIPFKSCFGECKKAPPKSILISVRAPVGDTNIADQEYAIGRGLASIFPKGEIEPDYLAFAIEFSKPKLRRVAQGSTFEAVSSQDILRLKVNFHSEPGERNKVSKVLNAIDSEIESNIKLLEKLNFQKQGLMQDLLTGQVRVNWR